MVKESRKIPLSSGINLNATVKEAGNPVWIIVTHGLGEHCGRHEYMLKLFSQYFNVCLYDLRGHGKSDGKRTHINNFEEYLYDLKEVINYLKETFSMKRYILFGHSMGGLITAAYMQNMVDKDFYPEKVYLSSPPVQGPGLLGKFLGTTPPAVSKSFASLPFSFELGGILDLKKLSHDSRVGDAYINDSLNSKKSQTRLLFGIAAKAKEVFSRPLRIDCPLYVSIGTKDVLVEPKALIKYFTEIEKNARLFVLEDAYHEMHNEIEKYRAPYFDFLKTSIQSTPTA